MRFLSLKFSRDQIIKTIGLILRNLLFFWLLISKYVQKIELRHKKQIPAESGMECWKDSS